MKDEVGIVIRVYQHVLVHWSITVLYNQIGSSVNQANVFDCHRDTDTASPGAPGSSNTTGTPTTTGTVTPSATNLAGMMAPLHWSWIGVFVALSVFAGMI